VEKPALVLKQVSKSFVSDDGSVFSALSDVSLNVSRGEFVSLLGPSGCGKSTILRLIAGLERPDIGLVEAGDLPNGRGPPSLGMVFQRDVLLDWRTILDNVLLPVEFAGGRRADATPRAKELLALYGLAGFENHYPWQLSGGMRQRASICRGLILAPSVLIMDEPFGALDALTRDELNIELQSLWMRTHKTILFVTHGIAEAVFLSDRVVVMASRPGRIAEILTIDLPRPRNSAVRSGAKFIEYTDRIRAIFERQGVFKKAES